ncbi:hypothetical protein [Mycobacterium branderi]|uniref:Uncharacterized protein n=1 Tax=Mycobacterium branderi TaxID=43348 RepID=A0A7I7WE35_9MYCO|nr:hypothetical protein [Mycobacterium branderi]MCV7236306.1 hypothetical protein [Mycobacterium branderi]ORA35477.1 hypothetical protein BST20_17980 [Mycobacterium branderi]BBZ15192.1 hypothetical protein MBRA_53870 [Mycobacterium branderi]
MLMSVIHAELAEKLYFGDDGALLAMDDAGVSEVLTAVTQAVQLGSARLNHGATTHHFVIETGTANVEFHNGAVLWRLDRAVAAEIIELLTEMHDNPGSGHHYVDLSKPSGLVLSLNEYPLNLLPPEAVFPPPPTPTGH